MLEFKRIELADREWAQPLLAMGNFQSSEYAFTNNYIYRETYNIEVARMNDYYIVRSGRKGHNKSFLFPAGSGDVKPVIEAMMQDAVERTEPLSIHGVTAEARATLEALFPDIFTFEETRDNFDYIYESEKLITLSGKKLHSKRNFINRFMAEYGDNWAFEPITKENLGECWEMNAEWCRQNGCDNDPSLREESCAVKCCFDNFFALDLQGGILRAHGKIVAFTMGRPLNSDTFIVHIEKAFSSVSGAYPMINKEFASYACRDFQFINREDDVGDDGLRQAKLSYKPHHMAEKFRVRLK